MAQKGHIPHNRGLCYEAKLRGDAHYFTGIPCTFGHIAKRYVNSGSCMECVKQRARKKYASYESVKLEEIRKNAKLRSAQWRKNNPEHENTIIVKKRWAQKNPEKESAKAAKRRADRIQRTPPWLTTMHKKEIGMLYWEAAELSKLLGEFYHVDHIEPLRGADVCGLHVPWNLQILTAKENLSKGNRVQRT